MTCCSSLALVFNSYSDSGLWVTVEDLRTETGFGRSSGCISLLAASVTQLSVGLKYVNLLKLMGRLDYSTDARAHKSQLIRCKVTYPEGHQSRDIYNRGRIL